ncbi:MAG: M48 family metalloprotease [bacterium JZ-2024 1]
MKYWFLSPLFLLGLFDWGPGLEKNFARMAESQIRQEYGYVTHPLLWKYVQQTGGKIAKVPERQKFPYKYYVVRALEENAFAVGAGYQFVTLGLLQMADTEDEVAAVIGHETAHNADKHVIQGIKDQFGVLALFLVLERKMSDDQELLYGLLATLRQLKMSRKDEFRADQLGVQYSALSGYNPYYALTLFDKLERAYPTGKMSKLEIAFSSHPRTPDRMDRIRGEIQKIINSPVGAELGENLLERGYPHEAREFLEKAPERTFQQDYALAQAYLLTGEREKAQLTWEKVRMQNPAIPALREPQSFSPSVPSETIDASPFLLALNSSLSVQSALVSKERAVVQESLDFLDKVTQSAHKPSFSAFENSVNVSNAMLELYLRDQTTLRLIEKTRELWRKTRGIPTYSASDLLEAHQCFTTALNALEGKSVEKQEAAEKAKKDVFTYSTFSLSELKKAKKEQEEYWNQLWKCSLSIYAIRVGDLFVEVEKRMPGFGLRYLENKTGISGETLRNHNVDYHRVGNFLAGYGQAIAGSASGGEKLDEKVAFSGREILEREKDPLALWAFYNLVAGDLLRMVSGPFYSAKPTLELITPVSE